LTERSEPKVEWIGAERLAEFAENDGAERSAERERSGERGLFTEIVWKAERLFRRSRSAHMLWWPGIPQSFYWTSKN